MGMISPLLFTVNIPTHAQTDFEAFLSDVVPVDEFEEVLGLTNATQNIDGVIADHNGGLFAIHRTTLADFSILKFKFDDFDMTATVVKTKAQIETDLGKTVLLEGGFGLNPEHSKLYLADSLDAPDITLFEIDLNHTDNLATTILQDSSLDGLQDFGVLPTGEIIIARGDSFGYVDPDASSPSYTEIYTAQDFLDSFGSGADAEPEAVAVNPRTGQVYVFAHDILQLFVIPDVLNPSPLPTHVDPGWGSVDLHDLGVDYDGNVYGWDEGSGDMVFWNGSKTSRHPLDEFFDAAEGGDHDHRQSNGSKDDHDHHGAVGITNWRGMSVQKANSNQAYMHLASGSDEGGLFRVTFGTDPIVDFTTFEVSGVPTAEFEEQLGLTTDTQNLDGVTLGLAPEVFAIHRTPLADLSFIRFDPDYFDSTFQLITTKADIETDLAKTILIEGGFSSDPGGTTLYLAENLDAPDVSLFGIDLQTGDASIILQATDLDGLQDHDTLLSREIVIARGGNFGFVDPDADSPTYIELFVEQDFLNAFGSGTEAEVESVATHPLSGVCYIFAHEILELFRVDNIFAASPTLEHISPGWGDVDLHDMTVDEDGNLYGWDEGNGDIVIWNGVNTFRHPIAEFFEAIEGGDHDHERGYRPKGDHDHEEAVGATNWRGIAARKINQSQAELWLADATDEHGLVHIVFGIAPGVLRALDWKHYN